jgi:uncharacterized membrane protein
MTLLVLELHVPDARSSSELVAGLATLAPSYLAVLIGYVFTAVRDRTVLH